MLQIKSISKQYKTGDLVQDALKNVSLNLRDNEFVSILGPSGSGKTTLLNIIGGLDRYDSGDLIINHVSTAQYKDRDWDSYRNHTIGFVFQSYNLIPHQSVLANVELALTIGGISKRERRERALLALEEVGLREQAHKRPNQMSGGQMQRVAIARALVNNPDILLADEPTGALDTETSVQVMELLKKVANDRLVIMVTHNPELAEQYSTRIVKLRDGQIIDDSDPFIIAEKELEKPEHKNLGKASMSVATALSLSFNNLLTKKGRTILTAFAGSIGIIGIALILSLSTGFQNYIDKIQEDTLTSYPLTITSETADTTSMLLSMVSEAGEATGENMVRERQYISTMFSKIGTNNLKALKKYLEKNSDKVDQMIALTKYHYSVSPLIYTINSEKEMTQLNPSTMMSSMMGGSSTTMASMGGMSTSVFNEMLDDREMLEGQYDVLAGRWPKKYDEMILVLPEPNGMSDLLVYSLGLRDDDELKDMIAKIMRGEAVENKNEPLEWTYDDLLKLSFKLVNPTDTYKYNETYGVYESMKNDKEYMQEVYENSLNLKIVGIVCAKDGSSTSGLMQGIGYTKELTEYVIKEASKSEIVKKQLKDEEVNVFSGKRFDDESTESGIDFQDMISVDTDALSAALGGNISEKDIEDLTKGYMNQISAAITTDTTKAEKAFSNTLVSLTNSMSQEYITANGAGTGNATLKQSQLDSVVSGFLNGSKATEQLKALEKDYVIPVDTLKTTYAGLLKGALLTAFALSPGSVGSEPAAILNNTVAQTVLTVYMAQEGVATAVEQMGAAMTQAVMQKTILSKVGELSGQLVAKIAGSFNVDESKIASAFHFNMSEEELARLMETMTSASVEQSAKTNLISLGYQDMNDPSAISFYFIDFDSKEMFVDFLKEYNDKMEKEDDKKVIKYTDVTGILMSSVKTIVDSVSYVLIAFVSISLVVSSIMIGIITYISVLERTKEIGVLRAIGASKKNISSIFNAETFIVGLSAGILGIVVTLLFLIPINAILHALTGNLNITAVLPVRGAIILVVLSVILTLIGGIIPSKQAAKKDPVLALRSE